MRSPATTERHWRSACPPRVNALLNNLHSLNLSIKKVEEPTRVVVSSRQQTLRVSIGNPHRCTCGKNQPCAHVLFVLAEHFHMDRGNPAMWQSGISELEIQDVLLASLAHGGSCFFCHESVQSGGECSTCGRTFHRKCLSLAACARRSTSTSSPCCAATISSYNEKQRVCSSCRKSPLGNLFRCVVCVDFWLCDGCYHKGSVHTEHPFGRKRLISASPTQEPEPADVTTLQYREIRPEDYATLLTLDSGSATVLDVATVHSLKSEVSSSASPGPCYICLLPLAPMDVCISLPCGHSFHFSCGEKWLTTYSNKCPVDQTVVEVPSRLSTSSPILASTQRDEETVRSSPILHLPRLSNVPERRDNPKRAIQRKKRHP